MRTNYRPDLGELPDNESEPIARHQRKAPGAPEIFADVKKALAFDGHSPERREYEAIALIGIHFNGLARRSYEQGLAKAADIARAHKEAPEANARLIAAAPKLLAMCQNALEALEGLSESNACMSDFERACIPALKAAIGQAISKTSALDYPETNYNRISNPDGV